MNNLEIITNESSQIHFKVVEPGEFFKFKGYYYLKIKEEIDEYDGITIIANAVNLVTNEIDVFDDYDEIISVEGLITITE